MSLMPFIDNMKVIYRPGKSISHVDCISRTRYVAGRDKPQEESPEKVFSGLVV
jgi:hypothetical protein